MSLDKNLNKIIIIDFGSQFTQLIARRVRELGVFSEIVSHKKIRLKDINNSIKGIVLSGGPMLDGWHDGKLAGSGMAVWDSRVELSAGRINYDEFMDIVTSSAPSDGHCNTMGTASTMNSLAEALGMSLTGNANIPAPYRERGQMAYRTGLRIVEMVKEDLTPSKIMTRKAFENAIVVNSAIGGSTNAQIHITAIARHVGIDLETDAWQNVGYDIPLMVNVQPAGKYLCESYHRAGGTAAVMNELLSNNKLHGDVITVSGKKMSECLNGLKIKDKDVISEFKNPLKTRAGFIVLKGNLFESAIMKTSVISDEFRKKFLSKPGKEGVLEGRAIVFAVNKSDKILDIKAVDQKLNSTIKKSLPQFKGVYVNYISALKRIKITYNPYHVFQPINLKIIDKVCSEIK